jgi:hypothetical protein
MKPMKIADKLVKVDTSFGVNRYDNGFLFTVSGRTETGDWKTVNIMCEDINSLSKLITEFSSLPGHE